MFVSHLGLTTGITTLISGSECYRHLMFNLDLYLIQGRQNIITTAITDFLASGLNQRLFLQTVFTQSISMILIGIPISNWKIKKTSFLYNPKLFLILQFTTCDIVKILNKSFDKMTQHILRMILHFWMTLFVCQY